MELWGDSRWVRRAGEEGAQNSRECEKWVWAPQECSVRNLPVHPRGEWGKPNAEKLLKAPLGDKLLIRKKKLIYAEPNQWQLLGKNGEKSALGWVLTFQKLCSPLIPKFKAGRFLGIRAQGWSSLEEEEEEEEEPCSCQDYLRSNPQAAPSPTKSISCTGMGEKPQF